MPLSLSPEMLARMALERPDLAAQIGASTGQPPPAAPAGPLNVDIRRAAPVPMLKPGLQGPPMAPVGQAIAGAPAAAPVATPPVAAPPAAPAQQVPDPNMLGLALSGVQGIQGQAAGPPPPISPQQFGGFPGAGGLQQLLALMGAGGSRR